MSPDAAAAPLVAAYDQDFRAGMAVSAAAADDPAVLLAAVAALPAPARDLLETLFVGVGVGEGVPMRFRSRIEADGEALWAAALLLPRATPSPGATINPRYYAASCRLNPGLATFVPLAEAHVGGDAPAGLPPADARWDAVVVAAALEADPPRVTRGATLRKDDVRALLGRLGGDPQRWELALALAQATGLARIAGGALCGCPESRGRPLADPLSLFEDDGRRRAAALLLRVVGEAWVSVERLCGALALRCPWALDDAAAFGHREAEWVRAAADALHRAGVLDGQRDADGVTALRRAAPRAPRPPGFLLMPDREILVAPGELAAADYGRLCRAAPYVDGDVMHRHRLCREGLVADMNAGHTDLLGFLTRFSRTGVPGPVRSGVQEWERAATRVTLWTGATVLEYPDGRWERVDGPLPPGTREIHYGGDAPAAFLVQDDDLIIPFGQDALSVRGAVAPLGPPAQRGSSGWVIPLRPPARIAEPARVLERLRRFHAGPLPGQLEAVVWGAASTDLRLVRALRIDAPPAALDALRRDRVLAPLLRGGGGVLLVDASDLPVVESRLARLGFRAFAAEG